MHSHSGQFCPGHAKDQLEDVIRRAISLNMRLISLTEHMPRTHDQDLYPEEVRMFAQSCSAICSYAYIVSCYNMLANVLILSTG